MLRSHERQLDLLNINNSEFDYAATGAFWWFSLGNNACQQKRVLCIFYKWLPERSSSKAKHGYCGYEQRGVAKGKRTGSIRRKKGRGRGSYGPIFDKKSVKQIIFLEKEHGSCVNQD